RGNFPKGFETTLARIAKHKGYIPTRTETLTKKNIGSFIKWSSSRYNEYKKKDVVDWAHKIMKGDYWVPVGRTDNQNLLREIAGSDDIETREVDSGIEVKVKKMVVQSGAYTDAYGGASYGSYLINGERGYIAGGFGDVNDFDEVDRVFFGSMTERGGQGSGHFEHAGRPGEVGGSSPSGARSDIPQDIRDTRFFHATPIEDHANSIIDDGRVIPGKSRSQGQLAPVSGRVYATSDPEYALIYALGADMSGSDLPDWMIEKDGRYGYIFEVDPDSLDDIQPDEDSIGRAISDDTYPWLTEMAE
ncbi:unnamed protein product, partial [marine sediment metagenome]